MKKVILLVCLFTIATFAHAQLTDGTYPVSLTESLIGWKVDYSIGTKGHTGTLKLASGNVVVKDGKIQGGNFVIDMNSVHVTDMKPDDGGKDLEKHLMDNDFLATSTHPKGYFTVLKSEPAPAGKVTISGYLILKGVSNNVVIPATVTESNGTLTVKAEVVVNRTLWGINYQSGIIGTIKDEAISDDMNITLNFVFRKAQ